MVRKSLALPRRSFVRSSARRRASLAIIALLSLTSCRVMEPTPTTPSVAAALRTCSAESLEPNCPPLAPREFRAVWVATVANIDWPTKPGLTIEQQKTEVTSMLNRLQALNMNAVLLQVRPSADAIYPSTLEPWAEWITGEQGRAPGYDPLQFWIDEARQRGIEVHAWFNPYRARHTKAASPNSRDHVSMRMPNAVKSYGGFQWLDPGEQAAQDHSFGVIMDVVKRYDIDGVHFDDYFYPYPVIEQVATQQIGGQNASDNALSGVANALNGQNNPAPSVVTRTAEREVDFPDEPSWKAYVASGGKLARADWRRDNVNRFVERVYRGIKAEKPWVRFGISPFGIGRPDRRPQGIVGFSQYDKLYADVELWLQRGWLDYLAPQLYWPIAQTPQAFPVLLEYWHAQNTAKRDIFPGLYTSRIDDTPRSWLPKELEDQISLVRSKTNAAQGHIHFSAVPIVQNRKDLQPSLARQYGSSALTTKSPSNWAKTENQLISDIVIELPLAPDYADVVVRSSQARLSPSVSANATRSAEPNLVALYARYGIEWQFSTLPMPAHRSGASTAPTNSVTNALPAIRLPRANASGALNAIAASVVDRFGYESERTVRDLTQ